MAYKCLPAVVTKGKFKDEQIIVEGTDKELWGKNWYEMMGIPAAMIYAVRESEEKLPEEGVVYGAKRPNGESTLFHESEINFLEEEL